MQRYTDINIRISSVGFVFYHEKSIALRTMKSIVIHERPWDNENCIFSIIILFSMSLSFFLSANDTIIFYLLVIKELSSLSSRWENS